MQNYALVSFFTKIVIECSAIVNEIFSGTAFCDIVNFALWRSSF